MKLFALGAFFLLVFATAAPVPAQQTETDFVPAHCLTASDIPYPINTTTSGLVSLSVGLDEDGHVADVQTIRDVPPLTAAALLAVKGWTFEPATLGAKAVASRIAIQVLFNPGNEAFGQAPPLATAANNTAQAQDYVSPRIQSAVYAHYPAQTLLSGAVVLDAQIARSGRVGKATPVYTTASLVDAAAAAVKKWRFTPGQFKGSPVRSNVVVAIVFRSSTISTPYGSPQ